jgi:hypothetical protein
MGDNCQFTIVLRHLREHYYPDMFLGVEAQVGCHSCFTGLADAVYIWRPPLLWNEEKWDEIKVVQFNRPEQSYQDVPSIKATRCLLDEFHLSPLLHLYHATLNPTPEAIDKVQRFTTEELDLPYAVLHYDGHSRKADKCINHEEAAVLVNLFLECGLVPLLVDMDYQSPLQQDTGVYHLDRRHPYLWDGERVGDASTIYQLISFCCGSSRAVFRAVGLV